MKRVDHNAPRFSLLILILGFLFLYIPIISLIVYSFNASRLVTVWAGFSTHWYYELFQDQEMMDAARVSLKLAFGTACASVVLGSMASMVMTRFPAFRSKTLFSTLLTAPLVMPEVITGLSLLLLFVLLGEWFSWFQQRGISNIWVAHVTLTLSYVTIIISSRLSELDRSLEEAAMDLGANRLTIFFTITLPIIAPALLSGWLLAFTLSLDDLVIASFTSGPDSTTLPMKIFSSVRMGINPEINALATLMIGFVTLAALLAWWSMWRTEKRRNRRNIALS